MPLGTCLSSKLKGGKTYDDLCAFWTQCVEATEKEGDGILTYELYFSSSAQQTACFEFYRTPEAITEHQAKSGPVINPGYATHLEPQPPLSMLRDEGVDKEVVDKLGWGLPWYLKMAGSFTREPVQTAAKAKGRHPEGVRVERRWLCEERVTEQTRNLIADLCKAVRDGNAGCLSYNVYLSEDDQRTVVVHEHYRDADALLAHVDTFREKHAERVLATFGEAARMKVCGEVGRGVSDLLDLTEASGPIYFTRLPGSIQN